MTFINEKNKSTLMIHYNLITFFTCVYNSDKPEKGLAALKSLHLKISNFEDMPVRPKASENAHVKVVKREEKTAVTLPRVVNGIVRRQNRYSLHKYINREPRNPVLTTIKYFENGGCPSDTETAQKQQLTLKENKGSQAGGITVTTEEQKLFIETKKDEFTDDQINPKKYEIMVSELTNNTLNLALTPLNTQKEIINMPQESIIKEDEIFGMSKEEAAAEAPKEPLIDQSEESSDISIHLNFSEETEIQPSQEFYFHLESTVEIKEAPSNAVIDSSLEKDNDEQAQESIDTQKILTVIEEEDDENATEIENNQGQNSVDTVDQKPNEDLNPPRVNKKYKRRKNIFQRFLNLFRRKKNQKINE